MTAARQETDDAPDDAVALAILHAVEWMCAGHYFRDILLGAGFILTPLVTK